MGAFERAPQVSLAQVKLFFGIVRLRTGRWIEYYETTRLAKEEAQDSVLEDLTLAAAVFPFMEILFLVARRLNGHSFRLLSSGQLAIISLS